MRWILLQAAPEPLAEYVPLFLLIAIGGGIGWLLAQLSQLVGPSRPSLKKSFVYESGMDPVGTAHERFSVKFYLVAMLFILFDIEVVFMYPWAVQFRQLVTEFGIFPLVEMLVFAGILFVGFIYIYKKGGLRWT
jgi:NADH-quinone oxidoreductase subunit A